MSRDRDTLGHQLPDAGKRMSEVSAASDDLQQRMMEFAPGTARCADRATH